MTNYFLPYDSAYSDSDVFPDWCFSGMKFKASGFGNSRDNRFIYFSLLSYITAIRYFFIVGTLDGAFPRVIAANTEWLRFSDKLHIDMGVLLDPISVMMLVVITTVSLMVHIYSLGYMKGKGL